MRIGVYGGTFDPPHMGHALVSAWLRWAERVDEVWLLPVGHHAFGKQPAPFATRVAWCEALAAAVGPWVRVCAVEGERGGTTYTLDTLTLLAARHPEHRFQLVLGADNLPSLPRWKGWDAIQARFDPIVVGREGCPPVADAPQFPNVSSTEVRERLSRGEDVSHLVPASVLRQMASRAGGPT